MLGTFLVGTTLFAMSLDGDPSAFKVTPRKKDDSIDIRIEKVRVMFIVKSPSGISQAVVERQAADRWPKTVVLRFHLQGLERLRISTATSTLEASVAMQAGKLIVRQWKDGKENAPLDEKSPFWTEFRVLRADGTPATTLPLQDGHIEATLPRTLLDDHPKAITVSWIDFYRN